MKPSSLRIMLVVFCLGVAVTTQAADNLLSRGAVRTHDIVVPAGTLMSCTLDEPKFSSATVSVGDPFLCHPRLMQQFGQTVFPRGTYFVGHLQADKDPGHFVGKGYLKLAFDRIGLPDSDLPLNAKVIAVDGYNVDRKGKIIGHGHPTRDVVEWMLPPLWPWKVLSLPARGPRPTLKGEVSITLRVMDDLVFPQTQTVRESAAPAPGFRRFGEQPSSFPSAKPQAAPQPPSVAEVRFQSVAAAAPAAQAGEVNSMAVPVLPADLLPERPPATAIVAKTTAPLTTPVAGATGTDPYNSWPADVTLFALANGNVFPATRYWRDQDQFWFVSDGDPVTLSLRDIDWSTTAKLNIARHVRVILRNAPAQN